MLATIIVCASHGTAHVRTIRPRVVRTKAGTKSLQASPSPPPSNLHFSRAGGIYGGRGAILPRTPADAHTTLYAMMQIKERMKDAACEAEKNAHFVQDRE